MAAINLLRTGVLLAALTAIFLAAGALIGGRNGMIIALVMAVGMNVWAWWGSDKAVLRMYGAQPVSRVTAPDLWALVEQLARQAGLPMPAVYIMQSDQPNAFATGRDPNHAAVAVTSGIMRALPRDELAGVIAHELAHIKNRDTLIMTVAATLAGAIGMLANFGFLFSSNRNGERHNPLMGLLIMILAPMAAMLVQMAISRTREFSADRMGAQICGQPMALARALERIESWAQRTSVPEADANPATAHLFIINPLHGGGMSGLFRTHPPTQARVAKLVELARSMVGGGGGTPGAGQAWTGAQPAASPGRRGSVPNAGAFGSGRGWQENPWHGERR